MAETGKYRLVTRSDFDGLVCAVLFKELDMIDEITFVHPKDMQDGKVAISGRDITTNLPYVEGCYLAFDHHHSEDLRHDGGKPANHIIVAEAPSAARVVWDHYGGKERFPRISEEMMAAVDQADSANYCAEDILDPGGWTLLNYIMDPRTGLGRFRDFRISNYQLMMELIEYCRRHPIEEILYLPDVLERVQLFAEHQIPHREQIQRCSTVHGNVVVLDIRDEDPIYAGNRFVVYALFPECNISIHVMWGRGKENTVLAVGKSILDRSSATDVGSLCLKYGGGGHRAAGTCQVPNDRAADVLKEVIAAMNADG